MSLTSTVYNIDDVTARQNSCFNEVIMCTDPFLSIKHIVKTTCLFLIFCCISSDFSDSSTRDTCIYSPGAEEVYLAPEYICHFFLDSLSTDSSDLKSAGCLTGNFGQFAQGGRLGFNHARMCVSKIEGYGSLFSFK